MAIMHEHLASAAYERIMKDPDGAATIKKWAADVATGEVQLEDFAVFGQTAPQAGSWPIEQLAAALQVEAGLRGGVFIYVQVPVGGTPSPDRFRRQNARVLTRLPTPFEARVDMTQHGEPSDGVLEWTAPIEMYQSTAVPFIDAQHSGHVMWKRDVAPQALPLEIGDTWPSCTLHHLLRDRGVARWPYGHDVLTILRYADEVPPSSVMGPGPLSRAIERQVRRHLNKDSVAPCLPPGS